VRRSNGKNRLVSLTLFFPEEICPGPLRPPATRTSLSTPEWTCNSRTRYFPSPGWTCDLQPQGRACRPKSGLVTHGRDLSRPQSGLVRRSNGKNLRDSTTVNRYHDDDATVTHRHTHKVSAQVLRSSLDSYAATTTTPMPSRRR
jgi:hypothetical protein